LEHPIGVEHGKTIAVTAIQAAGAIARRAPARYRQRRQARTIYDALRQLIYRRTKNLRAVQLLLGHSKLESTVRYLGIEVGDALEISEQTEI
jgi:site-specific recombinase XerC